MDMPNLTQVTFVFLIVGGGGLIKVSGCKNTRETSKFGQKLCEVKIIRIIKTSSAETAPILYILVSSKKNKWRYRRSWRKEKNRRFDLRRRDNMDSTLGPWAYKQEGLIHEYKTAVFVMWAYTQGGLIHRGAYTWVNTVYL